MKICFITTGDIQNIATSKRAFGMTEPLSKLNYQVFIIAEDTTNNRQRVKEEAPSAIPLWYSSSNSLKERQEKYKFLLRIKPDFIYISAVGVRNFIWSRSLAKTSYFLVEHSELASSIKNQPVLKRLLSLIFEKLSLLLFPGHIVASRYLENHIKSDSLRLGLNNSIHYSPYAYSASMLVPESDVSSRLQKLTASRKVIVYMGTLSQNYGIIDIIRAVSNLTLNRPNVILFVLGKGRDENIAKALIEKLNLQNNVFLEGYVSDKVMPSYLQLADTFISPLYETIQDIARCPSKLFLYIPFNRPIVTSKVGEAATLLGDNYEFYFQPNNIADMSEVLAKALDKKPDWIAPWNIKAHSWDQRARDMDMWLTSLTKK